MIEDEMIGWHHHLAGHDFEQALGDAEGQGSLVCRSQWGCKELDMTEQLNNNNNTFHKSVAHLTFSKCYLLKPQNFEVLSY